MTQTALAELTPEATADATAVSTPVPAEPTADPSNPGDPNEPSPEPEIPTGLMTLFRQMFTDAIGQAFQFVRDLGIIVFAGFFVVFVIIIIVVVKVIAPLLPKEALEVVHAAGKDGLEIAKAELERRHAEANKTETPLDNAVVETLKILHGVAVMLINLVPNIQTAQAAGPTQAPTIGIHFDDAAIERAAQQFVARAQERAQALSDTPRSDPGVWVDPEDEDDEPKG